MPDKLFYEQLKDKKVLLEIIRKAIPRAVPLSFGYIRVDVNNPYAATYREMLKAEKLTRIYEDIPIGRSNFYAMLAELHPEDTVVLVRLDHLSAMEHVILKLTRQLAEANVHIRLISNAARQMTPTSALALDILNHAEKLFPKLASDGGDGGSGNGGP